MEKYKKKSLKFMGFSRDMRKNELDNQRCVSRLKRFSIYRPLNEESVSEEIKEENSRIPTTGKPKVQADSRVELLKKWQQEKVMRKQQESKLKKPVFKIGVTKPSPSPSIGNKPLFALDTSRHLKSSFKVSNSQLFGKKPESCLASNIKTSMKVTNSQSSTKKPSVATGNLKTSAKVPSYQSSIKKPDVANESLKTSAKVPSYQSSIKKPDVATESLKTSAKDLKFQSTKSKIGIASKPESKWAKNKETNIQSLSVKPRADTPSKVVNKDQLSLNRKQPIIASKPLETKKESRLQPLNSKSKVTSTVRGIKSNIPSSGLPKPTISRTLSKDSDQTHIPKTNASKIPEGNSNDKHIPGKNIAKGIPKFPRTIPLQQKGSNISDKESEPESKVPIKPVDDFETFALGLNCVEPVKEKKKSFAPEGFKFQPPTQLSSSLFSEDGPSAIFLRIKNQHLRTSTPKQDSSDRKSSLETKDIEYLADEATKCLKDQNTECLKNENSLCSMNTDKKLEPANKHDLENLLSSSLEAVSLNDLKPKDCKQSLKFEFPEVVQTPNQEVMSLSTKIIPPEHSMVTEPPTNKSINSPTLLDSGETDKIDVNSTDISHTEVINPPILSVLVESDKTEMNAPDTGLADECKIAELSTDVDSIFLEDHYVQASANIVPVENAIENQFGLNGILQNQENDPVKMPIKSRNFRQSEKPGLMSINESLENTPKSALKKKVLESNFTPRRSLRLAKLSGNFISLDNLLDSPKPKDQNETGSNGYLTPRRSKRLSKFSVEFNSAENLFDIRRPTLYGTPEKENPIKKLHSKVTYDFDRLSTEMEEETRPRSTSYAKASLLPMSRPSVMRRSIKGDLMSFSPDV